VGDLGTLLGEAARDPVTAQRQARRLAARIGTLLQASLLLRFSPAAVSDAFVASRVADDNAAGLGLVGALPSHVDVAAVVARATPRPSNGG
jgi:putative acyl-CoA dehydrogenase